MWLMCKEYIWEVFLEEVWVEKLLILSRFFGKFTNFFYEFWNKVILKGNSGQKFANFCIRILHNCALFMVN